VYDKKAAKLEEDQKFLIDLSLEGNQGKKWVWNPLWIRRLGLASWVSLFLSIKKP